MQKSKKAIFFSTDALIAMLIIISILLIAFPALKFTKRETQIHYDILNTLSSLKLSESENPYLQSLISQGVINNTNLSLLEQIGEFYVTNITLARSLASSILEDIETNKNIGIWYGNSLIYSINQTPIETAENIETARQIISGIQEGGSVTGFSARAFLTSGLQNKYLYFGGYNGDGNITIRAEYNGNITDAEIELTINNDFKLYINGISNGTTYKKSTSEFAPVPYKIPINNFNTGINTIEIRGENLHIAGGFIKITYESSSLYEQPSRYYFPGINGLINVYDGFYIPNNLNTLDISLHLNTNYAAFLTIGNTTIFKNATQGEETIILTNSYLSTLLNYLDISKKTIPIRLGLENASYIVSGNKTNADVISITDLSGSMLGTKLTNAKLANKALIDSILNISENRVGLVGYDTHARKADYHQLSDNKASLNNIVDNIWNASGFTCICCGVLKAINCFDKNVFQDNFNNQIVGTNTIGWERGESGGFIDITDQALEGNRAVLISRTGSNNPYIRHIFPAQENNIAVEFLVNHTSGLGRVRIEIEDTDGIGSYRNYIIIKLYGGQIRNNDAPITPYNLNITYKIRADIVPGSATYNLYVNDALVGSSLPVFNSGLTNIARLRFSTETSSIGYTLDNVKVYLNEDLCQNTNPESRIRSAIVMSDGQANRGCGLDPVPDHDLDSDITNDPQDHAIEAACRAYQIHNITTHAVGFGSGADEATLQKIAQCGNGTYYFGNVDEIVSIYQQIAQSIIEAQYVEQTITTTGNVSTILYPDSYIEFNYAKQTFPYGLIITTEKKFDNNFSGAFTLPENAAIVETRTTSYSGPRWTDKVSINNNLVYNITEHGQDYIKIGDPYIIYISNSLIQQNNIVNTTTSISPTNSTLSSEYNKIIYTVVKNASVYSKISPISQGCNWNIQFEDNTNSTISIPMSYSGSENCYYQEGNQEYNDNDATQNAIFKLLQLLDLNSNSKVELKFTEQDLQIDLTEITGIPYTWSTEVQARTWY